MKTTHISYITQYLFKSKKGNFIKLHKTYSIDFKIKEHV